MRYDATCPLGAQRGSGIRCNSKAHTIVFFAENQGQNACGAKTPRTENEAKLGELIFFRIRQTINFKLF